MTDSTSSRLEMSPVRQGRPRAPLARHWADRTQQIGGLPFVSATPRRAAEELVDAAVEGGRGEHVHLANAYSVALADKDPVLASQALAAGGWNLPDGRPLAWLSSIRHDRPALHQVRGPQFFLDVCAGGVDRGLRHYLLGGTPEVLAQLEESLRIRFPGIRIVGSDSPPFRIPSSSELAHRDARIARSGAQVVWVGLGTPKQDVEAARLARSLPVVSVAVGAAFDYAAGTLQEAPLWLRAAGLEWAFRLAAEPRRLWRRYLFGNLRFIRAAVRWWHI